MKKLLLLTWVAALCFAFYGCGGPEEGQAFEKADPKGGTAVGRLKTDQGAEQGISGSGAPVEASKPGAEPIPPGG